MYLELRKEVIKMLKEIVKWGIYLLFVYPTVSWFGFVGCFAWTLLYWLVVDYVLSSSDYERRH